MGRKKIEKPRKERLFAKAIYLPRERMAEFEAMAKADNKLLGSWIQVNVGRFSEVEAFIRKEMDLLKDSKFPLKVAKLVAYNEVLTFIKELKK